MSILWNNKIGRSLQNALAIDHEEESRVALREVNKSKDVVTHLLEFASGTFIIKTWLDSHPLKPIPPLKGSPSTPEVRVNSHKHVYYHLLPH